MRFAVAVQKSSLLHYVRHLLGVHTISYGQLLKDEDIVEHCHLHQILPANACANSTVS